LPLFSTGRFSRPPTRRARTLEDQTDARAADPRLPAADRVTSSALRQAPLLLCFSHLRWDFVWQRPQHLLSRAAKHYRVIQWEEPKFEQGVEPRLELSERPGGITIALPVLPEGLSAPDGLLALRRLVDRLLARETEAPRVIWYYTPMMLAFTGHLDADLVVYDNMDELSLFRGSSQQMVDLEAKLLSRADVVFTGGMSLYEAKKDRHSNIHGFPSSIDFDHFAKARKLGDQDPADQRRSRTPASASSASSTSAWTWSWWARSPPFAPTGSS
jgi:hypothetical protein